MTSLSKLLTDPAALAVVKQRDVVESGPECRIGDIRNEAGRKSAEVFIYGAITPWAWDELGEVSANGFVGQLSALDVDDITLRIHSPGGDVYDALAITNAIKSHRARVTTVVEGLAASAASFIAQAGDRIIIRPNAEMMIHDPAGGVRGNPEQVSEYAKWLDRAGDNIAAIYADRAGGTVADWRQAMRDETWYSADEAVAAGLADETHSDPSAVVAPIEEEDDRESDAAAAFADVRRAFAHSCRAEARAPFMPVNAGRQEGSAVDLRQEILARLGIAETATDTMLLDTLGDMKDRAAAASDVAAVTAFAEANGLRVVDADRYGEMEAELTEHRSAAAERDQADRAAVVDAAVEKGKITPARRDHFVALMDADPEGTAALLDQLPDELAVPTVEKGTAPAADDSVDTEYQAFLDGLTNDSDAAGAGK